VWAPPSGSTQHLVACIGGETTSRIVAPFKPIGRAPVRPQHVSACMYRKPRFGAPSASRNLSLFRVKSSMTTAGCAPAQGCHLSGA
jgi:hypothetical protein